MCLGWDSMPNFHVLVWGLHEVECSFLPGEYTWIWPCLAMALAVVCQLSIRASGDMGQCYVSRSFWVDKNGYLLVGDISLLHGIFPTVGPLLSLWRLKVWMDHMREQEPSRVISLMVYMGFSFGLGGTGCMELLWILIGSQEFARVAFPVTMTPPRKSPGLGFKQVRGCV